MITTESFIYTCCAKKYKLREVNKPKTLSTHAASLYKHSRSRSQWQPYAPLVAPR